MENTKLSIKLLVDSTTNKVLFAEVGKEFVDFLFRIMSLPIGTVVKLVASTDMVGCLGVLYKSIESLNNNYFQANFSRELVLDCTTPVDVPLLCLSNTSKIAGSNVYTCPDLGCIDDSCYVTDDPESVCPKCQKKMSRKANYVAPTEGTDVAASSTEGKGKGKGFVKGVVTYMVMDNLDVKPMSTISGITLLNKFQVKDLSCLIEKDVEVTVKEAVGILKASLETQAVLTSVFLRNRKTE